jgi:hypothetical protein
MHDEMQLNCFSLQTSYYPNLRYPNGQEVPVRPYEYTKSNLYHHNGHSYYYGNYYGSNKEYYSGNYLLGNYQPAYYYGYTNNYNTYDPDDVELYEKRILDAIDIGFLVTVSTAPSTPCCFSTLAPEPAAGHDPEPVPSTSYLRSLFP